MVVTNVTSEVNEWHSVQYKSFGKLKTPDDGWLGPKHVEKGSEKKNNTSSCIADGTVLLYVKDSSAFYYRRPRRASQKFLCWTRPVKLFIHFYGICRSHFMHSGYRHANKTWHTREPCHYFVSSSYLASSYSSVFVDVVTAMPLSNMQWIQFQLTPSKWRVLAVQNSIILYEALCKLRPHWEWAVTRQQTYEYSFPFA